LQIINGGVGAYLSAIVVEADRVSINFSDFNRRNTCSAQYRPLELGDNKYVTIALADRYGRPAGVLVGSAAELRLLSGWPVGTHTFAVEATELVASAVTPVTETGVRALLTQSGDVITDDIWLVGDQGVVLRVLPDNIIQINVTGAPLFKRIQCLDENGQAIGDFAPRNYLKTINCCPPDKYGNFNLVVKSHNDDGTPRKQILRIFPEGNGLKIAAVGSRVL
jgi:hypothetical protein